MKSFSSVNDDFYADEKKVIINIINLGCGGAGSAHGIEEKECNPRAVKGDRRLGKREEVLMFINDSRSYS